MELGAYQLQIFLSLFVVLGAAFVALVCDLLKGNNEQLRELNVELKVRREEEQKRFELLLNQKEQAQQAPAATEAPAATAQRAQRTDRKRIVAQEALAAMERGAQMAAVPRRPRPPMPEPIQAPVVAEAPPVEQVVEHVYEHVMEQAVEAPAVAAMSAMPPLSAPPPPVIAAETTEPAAISKTEPTSGRDWSSLLNRKTGPAQPAAAAPSRNDLLEAVVEATGSSDPVQPAAAVLPAGFQDGFVLSRLVERRQPVSGLVVSIGVTAEEQQGEEVSSPEEVSTAVRTLVESLMGVEDFASQSGPDEYLLIFPSARGAAAQRRLSEVAQQLWDFQLRSMGKYSVLFSWGGVEVRSESIEEAISSATERMNETRRGRKLLSMDPDLRSSLPKAG
jgi:hypothetical protein